jgi:hypothetical protein
MDKFSSWILASTAEIKMFFSSVILNSMFSGFLVGSLVTIIIIGFVLSQNPNHLPLILRYSCPNGFNKLLGWHKDRNTICPLTYEAYEKIHARVRVLFLSSFIVFCVMTSLILWKA